MKIYFHHTADLFNGQVNARIPSSMMTCRAYICLICLSLILVSCWAPERVSTYKPPEPTVVEKEWEKAHQLERSGDVNGAIEKYGVLCRGAASYARACYDECRAMLDVAVDERSRACAASFVIQNPNSGLAPAMVRAVSNSYHFDSEQLAGADWLAQLALKVKKTDVWDSVHFERAKLFRSLEMLNEEEAALMEVVSLGRWGSQLWDNAIWRAIAIQRINKNDQKEEQLLLQMLSKKEDSRLIASYNSPYYDDALFRLGELHLERTETQKAYDVFQRLSTWETSRLRDDAMLQCAMIKKVQGDVTAACLHLKLLLERMPESGSVRKAKKMIKDWRCGS